MTEKLFEYVGAAAMWLVIKAFSMVTGAVRGLRASFSRARTWAPAEPVMASTRKADPVLAQELPSPVPRRGINLSIRPGFTASIAFHADGIVEATLRSVTEVNGRQSWFLLGTKVGNRTIEDLLSTVEKAAFDMIKELEAAGTPPVVEQPLPVLQPAVILQASQEPASKPVTQASKAVRPNPPQRVAPAASKSEGKVFMGRVIEAELVPSVDVPEGIFTLVLDQPGGEPVVLRGDALHSAMQMSGADVGDHISIERSMPYQGTHFNMSTGTVETSAHVQYTVKKEAVSV